MPHQVKTKSEGQRSRLQDFLDQVKGSQLFLTTDQPPEVPRMTAREELQAWVRNLDPQRQSSVVEYEPSGPAKRKPVEQPELPAGNEAPVAEIPYGDVNVGITSTLSRLTGLDPARMLARGRALRQGAPYLLGMDEEDVKKLTAKNPAYKDVLDRLTELQDFSHGYERYLADKFGDVQGGVRAAQQVERENLLRGILPEEQAKVQETFTARVEAEVERQMRFMYPMGRLEWASTPRGREMELKLTRKVADLLKETDPGTAQKLAEARADREGIPGVHRAALSDEEKRRWFQEHLEAEAAGSVERWHKEHPYLGTASDVSELLPYMTLAGLATKGLTKLGVKGATRLTQAGRGAAAFGAADVALQGVKSMTGAQPEMSLKQAALSTAGGAVAGVAGQAVFQRLAPRFRRAFGQGGERMAAALSSMVDVLAVTGAVDGAGVIERIEQGEDPEVVWKELWRLALSAGVAGAFGAAARPRVLPFSERLVRGRPEKISQDRVIDVDLGLARQRPVLIRRRPEQPAGEQAALGPGKPRLPEMGDVIRTPSGARLPVVEVRTRPSVDRRGAPRQLTAGIVRSPLGEYPVFTRQGTDGFVRRATATRPQKPVLSYAARRPSPERNIAQRDVEQAHSALMEVTAKAMREAFEAPAADQPALLALAEALNETRVRLQRVAEAKDSRLAADALGRGARSAINALARIEDRVNQTRLQDQGRKWLKARDKLARAVQGIFSGLANLPRDYRVTRRDTRSRAAVAAIQRATGWRYKDEAGRVAEFHEGMVRKLVQDIETGVVEVGRALMGRDSVTLQFKGGKRPPIRLKLPELLDPVFERAMSKLWGSERGAISVRAGSKKPETQPGGRFWGRQKVVLTRAERRAVARHEQDAYMEFFARSGKTAQRWLVHKPVRVLLGRLLKNPHFKTEAKVAAWFRANFYHSASAEVLGVHFRARAEAERLLADLADHQRDFYALMAGRAKGDARALGEAMWYGMQGSRLDAKKLGKDLAPAGKLISNMRETFHKIADILLEFGAITPTTYAAVKGGREYGPRLKRDDRLGPVLRLLRMKSPFDPVNTRQALRSWLRRRRLTAEKFAKTKGARTDFESQLEGMKREIAAAGEMMVVLETHRDKRLWSDTKPEDPGVYGWRHVSGKEWGPLEGKWVRGDAFDSIRESIPHTTAGWQLVDAILSMGKANLTVRAVQGLTLQVFGNIPYNNAAGMPFSPRAAREYATAFRHLFAKKPHAINDPLWTEFVRSDVYQNLGFTHDIMPQASYRQVLADMRSRTDLIPVLVDGLRMAVLTADKAAHLAGGQVITKGYRMGDAVHSYALYRYARAVKGLTETQALQKIDYYNNRAVMAFMRRPWFRRLISFSRWPYKAATRSVVEMARKPLSLLGVPLEPVTMHPSFGGPVRIAAQIGKWLGTMALIDAMMQSQHGMNDEEWEEAKLEAVHGNKSRSWWLVGMPWKESGQPTFLDLSLVNLWGAFGIGPDYQRPGMSKPEYVFRSMNILFGKALNVLAGTDYWGEDVGTRRAFTQAMWDLGMPRTYAALWAYVDQKGWEGKSDWTTPKEWLYRRLLGFPFRSAAGGSGREARARFEALLDAVDPISGETVIKKMSWRLPRQEFYVNPAVKQANPQLAGKAQEVLDTYHGQEYLKKKTWGMEKSFKE